MLICIFNNRSLIEQALKVWNVDREVYRPEISRTTFLMAKVLYQMKDSRAATDALKEAADLRRKIKYAMPKRDRDLTEEDFDELVTFWSR